MQHELVFKPPHGAGRRVLDLCISVLVVFGSIGAYPAITLAKHRSHEPHDPTATPSADPCAKPEQFVKDHINQIKALQSAIKSSGDSFKAQNTVAAWFGMSHELLPETEANIRKVAELRHEVHGIEELLRAQGCKTIDVDREVATP